MVVVVVMELRMLRLVVVVLLPLQAAVWDGVGVAAMLCVMVRLSHAPHGVGGCAWVLGHFALVVTAAVFVALTVVAVTVSAAVTVAVRVAASAAAALLAVIAAVHVVVIAAAAGLLC